MYILQQAIEIAQAYIVKNNVMYYNKERNAVADREGESNMSEEHTGGAGRFSAFKHLFGKGEKTVEAPVSEEPAAAVEEPDEAQLEQQREQKAAEAAAKFDTMPNRNNYLWELRKLLPDQRELMPLYSTFLYSGILPDSEQKAYFMNLQQQAELIMRQYLEESEKEEAERKPIDARVTVKVSGNRMQAWIFAFPPFYGGKDITEDAVRSALGKEAVTFGIDDELLSDFASQPAYLKLAVAARGQPPVDGESGKIIELVERDKAISLTADDKSRVDFKNLNWVQQVSKGDTLCQIIQPTKPQEGKNVQGLMVSGMLGKMPTIPKGKNTVVSEDGTCLISEVDGQVHYSGGKFNIEQLLVIGGNVDNSTGNLDVIGDLNISGDVLDGFSIKATGTIQVKGSVEGATLIAGGNIIIARGANGNSHGKLEAKGDITSKYLENCIIYAGGNITADSIINSDVYCNGSIHVVSGPGVIIGGTVRAVDRIEAKVIGNKASRVNTLFLGVPTDRQEEKESVSEELTRLRAEIEEIKKNMSFLSSGRKLPPEYERLRSSLQLKLSVNQMQLNKLEKQYEEITQPHVDLGKCRIVCGDIYPLTQVTIGHTVRIIAEENRKCNIFYADGEIQIGLG